MSKKTLLTTLALFLIICLERLIQFFNLMRFHNLGFTTEYVIGQVFTFLYTYLPVIVLTPALIYLIFSLKKERLYAFVPLVVTFVTLWLFSNFSFFNNYTSSNFIARYAQYKEVVQLVKQNKFKYKEFYPIEKSAYKNDYRKYGEVKCFIYKLPKKYKHIVKDNMYETTISVYCSENTGLIQIDFPINGIQFSYIYTEKGKLFKAGSKYHAIERKSYHWYYVIYQ